jgi:hypothetical protein
MPGPSTQIALSSLPFVAVGRGLEHYARDRQRHIAWASYVKAALSAVGVAATSELVTDQIVPWFPRYANISESVAFFCLVFVVLVEACLQLWLLPHFMRLQSLSRLILYRELYQWCGFWTSDALGVENLKNRAAALCPDLAKRSQEWLDDRIKNNKKPDGSDFHSPNEQDRDLRLLECLYENFSSWQSIAEHETGRKRNLTFAALIGSFVLLAVANASPSDLTIRMPFVTFILQFVLLKWCVDTYQDYLKWNMALGIFTERTCQLSEMKGTAGGNWQSLIHLLAADYAVATSKVAPASPESVEAVPFLTIERELIARKADRERSHRTP